MSVNKKRLACSSPVNRYGNFFIGVVILRLWWERRRLTVSALWLPHLTIKNSKENTEEGLHLSIRWQGSETTQRNAIDILLSSVTSCWPQLQNMFAIWQNVRWHRLCSYDWVGVWKQPFDGCLNSYHWPLFHVKAISSNIGIFLACGLSKTQTTIYDGHSLQNINTIG